MRIFWLCMFSSKERPVARPKPHPEFAELLDNFSDDAGADGTATFANREAQTFFHRDRGISLTVIWTLSPGMTISTPSGSSIAPVTSVVRK